MSIAAPPRRTDAGSRRRDQERAAEELIEAIRARLLERVDRGEDVAGLGSPDEVAEQVVDRLPLAANPWSEIVGPVYTSGSLQRELNIGRAGVSKAVGELRLLRLTTADGHNVYPAFQVNDGAVIPGLGAALKELHRGIDDPWTWAQWLNAPVPDGTGDGQEPDGRRRRHVDRLIAGEVAVVVEAARRAASSWQR